MLNRIVSAVVINVAVALSASAEPVSLRFSSNEIQAAKILYYVDGVEGADRMAAALDSLSGTHSVTTVTNEAQFATLLSSGAYDLGILFQQLNIGTGEGFAALSAHITAGGAAIGASWWRDDTRAIPFDANFTGTFNQTSFTVSGAQLVSGIANPVDLFNPGWGVFSTDLVATIGGTCAATFANASCAIVAGNDGRTFFNGFLNDTFSDGFEGQQLFVNEINAALGAATVPEPTSLLLLATGLAGIAVRRRRQNRA